jgi:hypothetical protein
MKIATLGCSYTHYSWPSYADVLQADNYGLAGIGNDRIWFTLLHLYKSKQLELYDAIVIQWTSPYRFDYLTSNGWTHNDGNISTSIQNRFIWKNIRTWYNEPYEKQRSENFIIAAKALLSTLDIKSYHMSMTNDLSDLVDLPNLMENFSSRYRFQKAPWTTQPFQDGHPTIQEHIKIAEKIANSLNITINHNMVKKCVDFHQQILQTDDFEEVLRMYKLNFPNRYITTGF